VPGFFGGPRRIVSLRGEKATQVRIPEGFEQRICTYVLEFKADGTCVSPTVLIFKGTGKKISPEELAEYSKLPDIVVLWQRKAWIDTDTEKRS
jgi:hypothetical protein